MRRRGSAMAAAGVVLLTVRPGVAAGQTTSSTTSTTSTISITTTTALATTTSTTVANPCVGRVCTEQPPAAVLSAASGEITADAGSNCWRGPSDTFTRCVALALVPGYRPPVLVVTQGELVTVRFSAPLPLTPTEVTLIREG